MKFSKKNIIFLVALGGLLISFIYRITNPYVQPRVNTLTHTGKAKVPKRNQTKPSEDHTVVSRFFSKKQISGKVYKDLFSLYNPPPKPGEDKKPEAGEKDKELKSISLVDPMEKDPLLAVKEYIVSYRFYGSYNRQGQRAVFLAKNKLVLVARTGDRIDGKYLIEEIQDDFIRIKALELNETIHIGIEEFTDE